MQGHDFFREGEGSLLQFTLVILSYKAERVDFDKNLKINKFLHLIVQLFIPQPMV